MAGKTIHEIFSDIDGPDVFDKYIDIAVKRQKNDYIEICCNNSDKSVSWYSFNAFAIAAQRFVASKPIVWPLFAYK